MNKQTKKTNNLKPNKKFYSTMFIFNFILAAIEFGIIALVSALSAKSVIGFAVCGGIFLCLAVLFNLFVVRRSNLRTVYFLYGTFVNAVVCAVPSVLIALFA